MVARLYMLLSVVNLARGVWAHFRLAVDSENERRGVPLATLFGVVLPDWTPESVELHERVHFWTGAPLALLLSQAFSWAVFHYGLGYGFWASLALGKVSQCAVRQAVEWVADLPSILWFGFRRYMKDLEESYLRVPGFGEQGPLRRAWTVALSLLLYPAWRILPLVWAMRRAATAGRGGPGSREG